MHELVFFFGLEITRFFVRCKLIEDKLVLSREDVLRGVGDFDNTESISEFSFSFTMSISSKDIICWRFVMSALKEEKKGKILKWSLCKVEKWMVKSNTEAWNQKNILWVFGCLITVTPDNAPFISFYVDSKNEKGKFCGISFLRICSAVPFSKKEKLT